MTKDSEKELKLLDYNELLQRHLELQELYFAPKKNSRNSSKSPSSDSLNDELKKNQSLREKSDKPTGGQVGHKGSTKPQEKPNTIVSHKQSHCTSCFSSLEGKEWKTAEKRQEFDIPPIVPYITQHDRLVTTCDCGCEISGVFPDHIQGHTQRGPNVASMVTYLNVRHKLPFKRLSEVLKDCVGIEISEGSINNILIRMGKKAKSKNAEIMEGLQGSEYVGTDETGNHVNGKKARVRVWQNDLFVYMCIDPSRGYKVVKEYFGESYRGVLGHDCWSAHNKTTAGAHQLCLAHLHRDLNYIIEKDKTGRSYEIRHLILKAQKAKKKWLSGSIGDEIWEKVKLRYEQELSQLCEGVSSVYKDTMRMMKRFKKHRDKIRTFMQYAFVPAHNNQSEQVIRNQKIHKKISGGFRSMDGGKRHCSLLSVIETSRRHGLGSLECLKLLYKGELIRRRPE